MEPAMAPTALEWRARDCRAADAVALGVALREEEEDEGAVLSSFLLLTRHDRLGDVYRAGEGWAWVAYV